MHARIERAPPKVILFYGKTGTGKTRRALEAGIDVCKKPGDDKWFDGYVDQKILLIDDFAGGRSKMSLSFILQVLDRYPVKLPVKGDFADLVADTVYVTSNIHPRLWYDYESRLEHYNALARRFHEVWYFNGSEDAFQVTPESFWHQWVEHSDENTIFQRLEEDSEETIEDLTTTQELSLAASADEEKELVDADKCRYYDLTESQ